MASALKPVPQIQLDRKAARAWVQRSSLAAARAAFPPAPEKACPAIARKAGTAKIIIHVPTRYAGQYAN